MNRDDELRRFKEINLTVIAAELAGYEIVRKKSTRHSVLMDSGTDKIIVSKNGNDYIYCSVFDPTSNGTAIDFIQNVVDRNCSLGKVRQHLRPFLNGQYVAKIKTTIAEKVAERIEPSSIDFLSVAARFSHFETIESPHPFACDQRCVPFELFQYPRLKGLVRHSPKHGSIIFPHWGQPGSDPNDNARCLVGYEIKGDSVSMFSRDGRKGLFISRAFDHDRVLVFTESGLDALSYLAFNSCADNTRIASIAGQLNQKFQVPLIESAIRNMESNSVIAAAFDADPQGNQLTGRLHDIFASVGRDDLTFADHRPLEAGQDWNDFLQRKASFETKPILGKVIQP